MQTTMWREELKSKAKLRSVDQQALVEKLRESKAKLAKRLRSMGLEDTRQAHNIASEKLESAYYSRWLGDKYPVVDLSFATGTLELLVRRVENGAEVVGPRDRDPEKPLETVVSIQRFAMQKETGRNRDLLCDFPHPRAELGKFYFSQFQRDRVKYRDYTGVVCCNRPEGSPKSLKRKLRDIAATLMEAQAAAIRASVGISSPQPGRTILWLPRIEDMYIREQIQVRDDPAVMVTLGEHSHLVAFWDSPEESPIEGILREFSEGAFDVARED